MLFSAFSWAFAVATLPGGYLLDRFGTIVIPTLTVLDGYIRMFRGVVDRKAPPVDDPNGCVDRGTLAKVAETAEREDA